MTSIGQRLTSRVGIRMRLTLLYGGILLVAGVILIAIFYVIFFNRYPGGRAVLQVLGEAPTGHGQQTIIFKSGARLTLPDVRAIQHRLDLHRNRVLGALLHQVLVALLAVIAAALALGWMMAGRALRPVRQVSDTARRVVGRNLGERIALQGPDDELKELADTFDAMLERLDKSFAAQRAFVANASHELRTPLATNRTLLEVALASGRVPAELRPVVDELLVSSHRSELILDGLLTLARSESQALRKLPVDLSDVAADAVEQTAREAADAHVTVDATPDPAITAGDRVLLERLAMNLVRNGIRHNKAGGWVTVATGPGRAPGQVELVVANSGPQVPPQQISSLFEPFRRLASDRGDVTEGIGLGLSIVRSVVASHGGQVSAEPGSEGGLVVRVCLPAIPEKSGTLSTQEVPRSPEDFPEGTWRAHSGRARIVNSGVGPVRWAWFRTARRS